MRFLGQKAEIELTQDECGPWRIAACSLPSRVWSDLEHDIPCLGLVLKRKESAEFPGQCSLFRHKFRHSSRSAFSHLTQAYCCRC